MQQITLYFFFFFANAGFEDNTIGGARERVGNLI
jgi:hypothetical protein